MKPAVLRPFEPADLRPIASIERESFGADAWPSKLFRAYASDERSTFTVAVCGRVVAGYLIDRRGPKGLEIESIAVRPGYRGRGIASLLMSDVIERARRDGVRWIGLMVRRDNAGAIALYRRFGFMRVATAGGYYEDGGTGWRMRLSLSG